MTIITSCVVAPPNTPARLRARRIQLGHTQTIVAAAVGVSHYTIGRWETGQRTPSPDKLTAWAAALDTLEPVDQEVDEVAVQRAAAGRTPWRSLNPAEQAACWALVRRRLTVTAASRLLHLSGTTAARREIDRTRREAA